MENKERINFFAVPLIGGILCIYAFFGLNLLVVPILLAENPFSPPLIFLFLVFGPILLDLNLGILLIVSAVTIKKGKTTFLEERGKILIFSWVIVGVSLGLGVLSITWFGAFLFFHEPGLVGGLVIILGDFFYKHVNKRNFIFGPPLGQEGEKLEPSPMKEHPPITYRKFCTNCGFKSGKESIKFCPKCGNKLVSK